jgi:putative redox protein
MGGIMEVLIQHLGAVQFEIKARQHTLICDQPAENQGYDEGITPPELLLASLGTCAAYYAVDYLNRNTLSSEGTKVRVTAEKVKGPFRLDNFKVEVDVPGELDDQHLRGLEEAVHRCLIHATLQHPPQIETEIKAAVAV